MKPEISILLPSLRSELVNRTIQEFENTNSNCNYEIIVVSPFEVIGTKVKWVKEPIKLGSVLATIIAYNCSSSEYIMYFSDDVSPTKDCLRNILRDIKQYNDIEQKPVIGAFKMITPEGMEIGPFGAYNKLYACYGCLSKKTIEKIGGFFNKKFLYSWTDIDLSLRCWISGGEVIKCNDAIVIPRQIEDEVYKQHRGRFQEDFNTFADIWHEKLGEGIPKIHGEVNKKLK